MKNRINRSNKINIKTNSKTMVAENIEEQYFYVILTLTSCFYELFYFLIYKLIIFCL
jgi:hypothetical protein